MPLSAEDVTHAAALARLPLQPGEAAALAAALTPLPTSPPAGVEVLASAESVAPMPPSGDDPPPLRDDAGLPDPLLLAPDQFAPAVFAGYFRVGPAAPRAGRAR